ncbi:MAG TPA: heparan-alpha-glucosaminide N-acetyltransferase domain-containing protein, partial [Puia sp.]|nr:heparan-alpha-glucosaminide N-acetyltransferase domain-containing protein [Puia sp.]
WITHLCAPAFVFLSGTSAWLSLNRRFLLKRGVALLLIEFTIVNFALSFDIRFRLQIFEVIAAIGTGMILLSFLSRLSTKTILVLALLLIFGHDLVLRIPMPKDPAVSVPGSLLFAPNAFPLGAGRLFVVAYPILPWLGIMLAGFSAGRLFTLPVQQRTRIFVRLGVASLALFVLLRLSNWYGDPFPWSVQRNAVYTFLSFMNVTKYPPSLLFALVTLGILFLILAAAEAKDNPLTRRLIVYGRVPLFFFIVHLYLIHGLLIAIVLLQGYPWSALDFSPFKFGRPDGAGLSLSQIYLVWACVVVALYPVCSWYGRCKALHKEKRWLRYL